MERVIIPTSIIAVINGLDSWHLGKVKDAIEALPDRHHTPIDDSFVYVGNYKIVYDILEDKPEGHGYHRRGDNSISVASITFEQRAHVVLASWGQWEDHDERIEKAFLSPEKAELHQKELQEEQATYDSLLVLQAVAGDALIGLDKLHWTVVSLDPNNFATKPGSVCDNIQAERKKIEKALKELAIVYEYLLTGKMPT